MLAKPFVRIAVDPKLRRFDFLNYAIAARAPILLVSSEADKIVRPRNMRDFAEQLRVRGAEVSIVSVPGGHGSGLKQQASLAAIRKFIGERRGR
jgi:predicted esterase